jgi:glycosyltransferase involved in cell wall biosynthesis
MNSVLNQTFQDFEYIVIDGGSTDGSVNLIRKSKDSLAYWISEKDTGIYNAMNKGIKQARGEYLLFLNSGDYLYKEDVLDRIIEKQLKSDIIYGDMILDLEDIDSRKMIKIKEKKISQYFFMKNSLPHPCSFIKKSLFDKIGLYNESLKIVADYEFFLKAILKAGATFTHIPHNRILSF